jgi:hypothetical protein
MTGEALQRRLKEGFGQGEGADYKPFLRTSDLPAYSICSIINSVWKYHRDYHLLSQPERHYFYILLWSYAVREIREQFPLLPLEHTVEIARRIGIKHPSDANGWRVLTTDFLIFTGERREWRRARTIKLSQDLDEKRTMELFEIERIFWLENGLEDWGIVTEDEIPEAVWQNVKWVHDFRDEQKLFPIRPETIARASDWFLNQVQRTPWVRMDNLGLECDAALGSRLGTGLKIIRHLIANKILVVDINVLLRTDRPIHFDIRVQ